VRAELHHVTVLDRPRLALVGIDDDVARRRLARDRLPLDPGREPGASVAGQTGRLQLLDDPVVRRELAEELETAADGGAPATAADASADDEAEPGVEQEAAEVAVADPAPAGEADGDAAGEDPAS